MDVRDFEIFTRLLDRPFESFEQIGRAVGMTGAGVKARVARLEAEGFLAAIYCVPAPEPLGLRAHGHVFAGGRGDVRLEDVLRLESVVVTVEYSDGPVSVISYSRQDEPAVPPALVDLLGEPQLVAAVRLTRLDPRRATLGPLDWRVMRALVEDPTASVTHLAERVGLTRRTVARRREALLEAGAIRAMPAVREGNARGITIAHFFIMGESGTAAARAVRGAPRAFVIAELVEPPGVSFATVAPSLGEIVEVERALRGAPGVVDVARLTPLRVLVARERVARWVDEQQALWGSRPTRA